MKLLSFVVIWFAMGVLATTGTSLANTIYFSPITENSPVLPSGQLYADISDATADGVSKATIVFHNNVGIDSAITNIFADNTASVLNSLLSVINVDADPGNDLLFVVGNSAPPSLPGANNAIPLFVETSVLGAEASHNSGSLIKHSINDANDSVQLTYDLTSGKTYADVLSDLTSGTLRFGLHVQAIAGGTSDSYVNTSVPEPGAACLLLIVGLALTGALSIKRGGVGDC
jgi:hypothetical protein